MGSSKKPRKKPGKRKVEAARGPGAGQGASDEAAVEALARVRSESFVGLCASIEDIRRRLDVLERGIERTLLLHERTNTLLELLAGSAFDMELDAPPRR
jgi:hypothetical protein